MEYYKKAIEKEPLGLLFYNNCAACYIELKDYDKAMEMCDEALKLSEENKLRDFIMLSKIYARKASIYNKLKRY